MKSLTPEPSKSVSAPFLKEHFQTALFEAFLQDRQQLGVRSRGKD